MSEQTALIIGPGNSFSFELAQRFHDNDYTIGLLGRDGQSMERLSSKLQDAEIPHEIAYADVRSNGELENAMQDLAAILPPWKAIIHNVKYSPHGDALSLSSEALLDSLNTNVVSLQRIARFAVFEWARTRETSFIVSGGGYKDAPVEDKIALAASKGALHSFCLAMQETMQDYSVDVKEIVIDGWVDSTDGISPEETADYFWRVHSRAPYGTYMLRTRS